MEKQEFYKFIGRLVIFIHGLYVLLCYRSHRFITDFSFGD